MMVGMKRLAERILGSSKVVVFTGAGVSTLCGIPDFRGPQGLYKQPDAERIFDIDWFHRDPTIYYRGCRELIYGLREVTPGKIHRLLADLERAGNVRGVITQNIDMLHQKAGSRMVCEVHGSPIIHRCLQCGDKKEFEQICRMLEEAEVARCGICGSAYKPDVTFFGEALPEAAFNASVKLAREAELMVVLGSSLTVHPAASLPLLTVRAGGELAIVNAQATPYDDMATCRGEDLLTFAEAISRQSGLGAPLREQSK